MLAGGEAVETDLPTEGLNLDLPAVATDSVTIGINAIEGAGLGSVGLAEVQCPVSIRVNAYSCPMTCSDERLEMRSWPP